ncbi:MAG: hypothetical protein KC652_05745 [Cyanobacteria bacterium HKST-UBA01]|nr:hypothetical protein [Cyanobacteria bacterium HKST-UBA01]
MMEENQGTGENPKPKPKTQPSLGGGGKPPRPTAVGLSGSSGDGGDNFVRGQVVSCKVVGIDLRGYSIEILGTGIRGLLLSEHYFASGSTIHACFERWSPSGKAEFIPMEPPSDAGHKRPGSRREYYLPDGSQTSFQDLFGQVKVDRFPFEAGEKQAFNRAIDLFIPPQADSERSRFSGGAFPFKELVLRLKQMRFNGVLQGQSSKFFSRGGVIFLDGQVVGAVYSNNFQKGVLESRASLTALFNDMLDEESQIETYDLDRDLIEAYSALFVGGRLESDGESRGMPYLNALLDEFTAQKITGVITVSISFGTELCIILFKDGDFKLSFLTQERRCTRDSQGRQEVLGDFNKRKISRIEAVVCLPEEKRIHFDPELYISF